MTKLLQIYKCEVCGNMVEMVHESVGELVCCNKPMVLLEEQTADAATEKHVPVVEVKGASIFAKVGSVAHPMEEKHYIEWIEIVSENGGRAYRKFLKPGVAPEAEFNKPDGKYTVREYCNVHGLWKKDE